MKGHPLLVVFIVTALALTACAGFSPMRTSRTDSELGSRQKADEIDRNDVVVKSTEESAARAERAAAEAALAAERAAAEAAAAAQREAEVARTAGSASSTAGFDTQSLPSDAKAGECFAQVLIPPTYRTETDRVLESEASERVQITPARFEWAEERVLVQEASEQIEVVPAEFASVEERVLVKPASTNLVEIPAKHEWTEERRLVEPAREVWKKGNGPVEKVDNATGEIMCLVEVPATYKTVRKRVLVEPARTEKVEIPAEYRTVKKRVLVKPATTRKIVIPAKYDTVMVRRLVSASQEERIEIPAKYETVTRTVQATAARTEWRRVLCETNMSRNTVMAVQRVLLDKGYDPGPIDGVYGRKTEAAVRSFQRARRLPTGGLTMETVQALGVRL